MPAGEEYLLYLLVDDVIILHADALSCSVRQATDQLRNAASLEGAVARPLWHATYGEADLALQAAVLAHGLAEGQPFVDGNKRTALAAAITFLRINGWDLSGTPQERADWILALADGGTVEELADRLRRAMRPGR